MENRNNFKQMTKIFMYGRYGRKIKSRYRILNTEDWNRHD